MTKMTVKAEWHYTVVPITDEERAKFNIADELRMKILDESNYVMAFVRDLEHAEKELELEVSDLNADVATIEKEET